MSYGKRHKETKYETLLKGFKGTVDSIPLTVQEEIIDFYAEAGSIQALEAEYDIPAELVRAVLSQPDLMQRALDRRRGEFSLRFVNEVMPAAMDRAAAGKTNSVQAAKLVSQVLGIIPEGRPVGRPKKAEQEESPSIESRLMKLTQSGGKKALKGSPKLPNLDTSK